MHASVLVAMRERGRWQDTRDFQHCFIVIHHHVLYVFRGICQPHQGIMGTLQITRGGVLKHVARGTTENQLSSTSALKSKQNLTLWTTDTKVQASPCSTRQQMFLIVTRSFSLINKYTCLYSESFFNYCIFEVHVNATEEVIKIIYSLPVPGFYSDISNLLSFTEDNALI